MSTQKPSRLHHYIPQHYLKGFAKKPNKKAKLHVFDMHKMGWLQNPTNTKRVGAVKDFNRLNVKGLSIDALEKSLSGFESQSGKVLNLIRESKNRPEGDDFICLMNLVALMSVRTPQTRENARDFQKKIMTQITDLTLATKERWESSVKQMREAGYGSDLPDITYEEMLQFHQEGKYEITIANQAFYHAEFNALETVKETLMARKWTFIVVDPDIGHFVCCDQPVRLRWNSPDLAEGSWPPGHGMTSTEVIFPISKEIAMVGCFEGREGTLYASQELVAKVNRAVIEGCQRHIYSSRKEFELIGQGNRIFRSNDMPQLFQNEKGPF